MGWYNSSWTYRQKVIIDATKVDEIFQVFPIYTSKLGNDFWANAKAGAADVRITQADGITEVARCCMTHDTGTKTGLILASVIADVSISVNSSYWVYFGNAAASDYSASATYGEQAAFSGYAGAYFPGMATRDFTAGGRTLTAVNTPGTAASGFEGILAATYNGTSQYHHNNGTPAVTDWPITLEAYGSANNGTHIGTTIGLSSTTDTDPLALLSFDGTTGTDRARGLFRGDTGAGLISIAFSTGTFTATTPAYIATTRDDDSGTSRTYIDGANVGTNSSGISVPTLNRTAIGAIVQSSVIGYLDGNVAVALLSDSVRSADYVSTMHNAWSSSTFFAAAQVDIETLGYVYPATTGNIDNGGGSISWVNTANAVDESNATAATCTVIDYEVAKYLACTNFGFSIPSDSTVAGVQVEVTHKADNTAYFNITRGPWKLISSAAVIGSDTSDGLTMPNTSTRTVVGSESNLWGATLTPTIVNASDFGVGLSYVCSDVYSGSVISVYSVRMRLTYNAASGNNGSFFSFFNSFGNVA